MSDDKAVDEFKSGEPEIRGGDRPTDYITEAPLPIPPKTWPLHADATEDDLDDDES